jgi:hypothetical protein
MPLMGFHHIDVDSDYDLIAEVTGQLMRRLLDPTTHNHAKRELLCRRPARRGRPIRRGTTLCGVMTQTRQATRLDCTREQADAQSPDLMTAPDLSDAPGG